MTVSHTGSDQHE